MTGKQRAYLRSLANGLQSKYQFGKNDLNDNFIRQIDAALEANELIKISVLETSPMTPRELSDRLCELTGAEGVQTIGSKIVLYRRSKESPVIVIPK